MSLLYESKKKFKRELRKYVAMIFTDTEPVDLSRQRVNVQQQLADVRCCAAAVSSAAAQITPASKDITHQLDAKEKKKKINISSGDVNNNSTSAAKQLTSTVAATSTQLTAPAEHFLRGMLTTSLSSVPSCVSFTHFENNNNNSNNDKERLTELDVLMSFAEECIAGAQYLMERELYNDAAELCLQSLAKEVLTTLRGVVAEVEEEKNLIIRHVNFGGGNGVNNKSELCGLKPASVTNNDDKYNDSVDDDSCGYYEDKQSRRAVSLKMQSHVKELIPAWRLVVQFDILHHMCEFYLLFCKDILTEERQALFVSASSHIEALTLRLLTVAAVDADDSYHILFNGTITVYEMCLDLMRKAGDCVDSILECVIRNIAHCLNICESATLKLATVRYMPWRIRLYDYIASCYERQGAYMDALYIAQRAYKKVRELVDLEMLDTVPPPEKSQEIMLCSLDHVSLNILRYTWLVNSTVTTSNGLVINNTIGSGGNNTNDENFTGTQLSQLQLSSNEMPRNGSEMIDLAWQLLLKVELLKRPTGSPLSTTQTSLRGVNAAKQQRQDVLKKEQTAKRIQGALIRFLLSFATSELIPPPFTKAFRKSCYEGGRRRGSSSHFRSLILRSSTYPFCEWAIKALETLLQRAVCVYIEENLDVKHEFTTDEFTELSSLLSARQQTPQATSVTFTSKNSKGKKNTISQGRSHRLQNTQTINLSALQDEIFVSNIKLEHFLYNLAFLNVETYFDGKEICVLKTSKFGMVNEESLMLAFLLHCVLYNGNNEKLFVCLCTCSLLSFRQQRRYFDEQERIKEETMNKAANKKKNNFLMLKKTLSMRIFDVLSVSLSLLRNMCRSRSITSMRINNLLLISNELEELVELCTDLKTRSVLSKMSKGKKDITNITTNATVTTINTINSNIKSTTNKILQLFLPGTSRVFSISFVTLCKLLIEECSDFLLRRLNSFVPSSLMSVSFHKNNITTDTTRKKIRRRRTSSLCEKVVETNLEINEDVEKIIDNYYNIMGTCLDAKVKNGLTDATKIGEVVLLYVQEVHAEVSVDNNIDNNNKNVTSNDCDITDYQDNNCDNNGDNNNCSSTIEKVTTSTIIIKKQNENCLQPTYAADEPMQLLRKKCNRIRMALDAIHMSLRCLEMPQSRASLIKSGVSTTITTKGAIGGAAAIVIENTTANTTKILEKEDTEKEKELIKICRENEIRDMRTELTRWMIKLRWCFAIHREHYASLEKYKADIKLLMNRQANRKVYGAVTLKERNVLEVILKTKPQAPQTSEDEKKRLLTWARNEGDELLYALVLMCLAPYQLQLKTRRKTLEEAFNVLKRYESNRTQHSSGVNCEKDQFETFFLLRQNEESAYSAFMIWCYAVTISGKLGFTTITESAKNVLLSVFAKNYNGNSHMTSIIEKYEEKDNEENIQREKKDKKNDFTALNTNLYTTGVENKNFQSFVLAVQPNEEVLAISSTLQIRILALALLWMSTMEVRRIPYCNFDTTGIMSFTNKSILLDVPFKQRYGFAKTQLWYLRGAYGIEFAMQLAERVNDSGLMLQCAFELFNTLYPSLVDENYCSFLLQPLLTLCKMLLLQPDYVWSDAYVQRLAVCSLDALLKTLRKMLTAGPDTVTNVLNSQLSTIIETTLTEPLDNNTMNFLSTMPIFFQKGYAFFLRLFVHVWTLVYNHPNPRQLRYRESVRQEEIAVQRVLGNTRGEWNKCVNRSGAESTVSTPISHLPRSNSLANATNTLTAAGETGAPAFPGAYYTITDFVFNDTVPIELLELLGDVLFTVPGGAFFLSQVSGQSCEKLLAQTTSIRGTFDGLVGVPAWLLTIARALANKTPYVALDCLQQVKDNPLYVKTAVYIVEYFLKQGDTATACCVATDALQTISDLQNSVREHQQSVVENMNIWLEREGYVLVTHTRQSKVTVEDQQVKSKERKRKSTIKKSAETQIQAEVKEENFSSLDGKQWTLGERQMLRQLTRGVAWMRRRRALRWVRSRILQFTAPFRAQLEFYLSICTQQLIVQKRRQLQEGDQTAAANVAAAVTKMPQGVKGKTRSEDLATSVAVRNEELRLEEEENKKRFVQHASRAAMLFNRCGFPSRTFKVISHAINGLRLFVCNDPPDMALSSEQLLQKGCGVELNNNSQGAPYTKNNIFVELKKSLSSAFGSENNIIMEKADSVIQTLKEWGPLVLPLARALHEMLVLIWAGFFDNRRDVEFLQPSAVKVWRNVLLEEQLRFQGRVPSLQVHTSPSGQYEEARLAHLATVNCVRLARSLRTRLVELEAAESCDRVATHLQWLNELLELLINYVENFLLPSPLERYVAQVKEDISNTEVLQQRVLSANKRTLSVGVTKKTLKATVHESVTPHVNCSPEIITLRLGPELSAEKIIDNFMFLMRYMQFSCQLPSLELSLETHKLTKGFFASELLPFVLSMQHSIGILQNDDLINEYAELYQNLPMHKSLVQKSQRMWEKYTITEAYSRVINRLTKTLLPSRRATVATYANSASIVHCDTESKEGVQKGSAANLMLPNKRENCVTVYDVVSCFDTAIAFLRKRRLFGLLTERLYELGRIHFLHRQRVDAERCWLEAVDAALEVPESLKQPISTWTNFSSSAVGFPRVLLAVMSLSSLAMYIYREQQGKAVDAYLLAARIIERFFEQNGTSNFSKQLRDFGGFTLEDIIVLPHLGDCMLTLMPQIVHYMLFIAWELLKFKFCFYSAMVASLTEYLARVHTRHVASTVEARLVQAVAASYFGNHKAAMKVLRNVCQGVRIPFFSIDETGLCVKAAAEFIEASKFAKVGKRVDGTGVAGFSNRINDQQLQQTQSQLQSKFELYLSPEGLYNDNELPVTSGNMSCVQIFMAHCFKEKSFLFSTANTSTPQSFFLPTTPTQITVTTSAAESNTSALHEAVAVSYGLRLSLRVELAVAESLTALGSKEAAYLWCTTVETQRPVTNDKRVTRARGALAVPLHGVSASACLEALTAAECILHSLIMRLDEIYGTQVDGSNSNNNNTNTTTTNTYKKSPMREKNNSKTQKDVQERRSANMEKIYIQCTSELLLARIYAARGECTKAMVLLQGLIVRFNKSDENDLFYVACHTSPSYLWTATTHTFWCSVYELMVRIHIRLHEYTTAQQVIRDALALCEQCSDPYSGRVFSLYEAAITARTGDIPKVMETLYALEKVSHSLKIDGRDDMLHAWILIGIESLEYVETQSVKRGIFSSSVERLEFAVQALQKYCEMHGLITDYLPSEKIKMTQSSCFSTTAVEVVREQQQQAIVAWNVTVIFLHQAINLLSKEYIQLGKLHLAEGLLRHAVYTLSLQYDSSAHPTPLIESCFMLARLLCLATPSLLTEQQKSKEPTEAMMCQELALEEDVLRALDPLRQEPVRLLINVVNKAVTSGTHDYTILRQALLYLALLLSRAGRLFHCLAANCVVVAKFVEDMQFHAFSGTSVFSMYCEENIQLGSDINFAEDIVAVIQSTRRGLGHISEKEGNTVAEYITTPLSQRATPELLRSTSRNRNEKEEVNQKNIITLPIIVSAFASLHRKNSLKLLFPPLEFLDLETALQHLRAFLQLKTAPLSGQYMWYNNTTVTDTFIKQLSQQQQQQARVREGSSRGFRVSSMIPDVSTSVTIGASLLPPIVISKLPPLLSFSTLANLGIPKVNTIICQSFSSDTAKALYVAESNRSVCREGGEENGVTHVERSFIAKPSTLTFSLFVSPIYDPTVTQPPPLNEKTQTSHQNKKQARGMRRNSLCTTDPKGVGCTASIEPLWSETRCVVFELPIDDLQALLSQAMYTLQLMENSASSATVLTGENVEENVSVEAMLSQQINQTMAVLNAKTTPVTNSKKGTRSAQHPEYFVSMNTTPANNIIVGVATAAEMSPATSDNADEIPALDEAKSKLITGFIEMFVRSIIPLALVDCNIMERSVQALLPRCAITIDVVRFLRSIASGNCGSVSLFHPGIYEWFLRIANFVIEHM